ncbi:hypothetical protein [Streptomyces sp. URMC 129]|uniref:hypothetical protein n=1 Tax=Streptomyces sp. URMC 129 TaxID=3423407 RepID=UPI003F1DD4CA
MSRRSLPAAGACAALSVLLTTTGCLGTAGADAELPGVLAQVRFTILPPDGITYVDAERARELVDEDPERFAFVADLGTPLPADGYVPDPDGAEAAVTVGFTDHYGYWVGRFDVDDVEGDLADQGFEEEQGIWRSEEAGRTFQVSGDRIVWGDEDFSPARLEEGESVADSLDYAEVTDCLGSVYRADFIQGEENAAVPLYAYGHGAESEDETWTVLCVLTSDAETADEAAGLLRETIGNHPDTYEDAEVERLTGGEGVRVTVPDTRPEQLPGRLLSTDVGLMRTLAQL